jgi:hypothetical protein
VTRAVAAARPGGFEGPPGRVPPTAAHTTVIGSTQLLIKSADVRVSGGVVLVGERLGDQLLDLPVASAGEPLPRVDQVGATAPAERTATWLTGEDPNEPGRTVTLSDFKLTGDFQDRHRRERWPVIVLQ